MPKRDFLTLTDLSIADAREVLALARVLKDERKENPARRNTLLAGRSVAIVLEKASTRTRVSFEVGVSQLGGYPVVLSVEGSQLGRGEPIRDTARVLAGYCDAIAYRTSSPKRLMQMASAAVPVINALSDDGHPVQVLCDVFTIEEAFARAGTPRSIDQLKVAFIGDCSSNMARSWVEAAALFGFKLALAAPADYLPPHEELERARPFVTVHQDPRDAAAGADAINTDVWTSMGQEAENAHRLEAFAGWTVNEAMLARSPAHAIVLHCLPAHRGEEIDEATLEGPRSRVWDQAENRLHVQKALLVWLLGLSGEVKK
ncbi:MAG TPA: ornithine carbamoyltransferase [Polyangiaceae bacterium]|jgi:ornithine carbamoyltransferase